MRAIPREDRAKPEFGRLQREQQSQILAVKYHSLRQRRALAEVAGDAAAARWLVEREADALAKLEASARP